MSLTDSPVAGGTWFLVAGKTGAGKSTLGRQIEKSHRAVVFSIDEWMNALYWQDCPEKNDYPWAIERVRRCEEQIARIAASLAHKGVSSVLDLGFSERAQRERWLHKARAAAVAVKLLVAEAPIEVRWQRVCERNTQAGSTHVFEVTREMFDFMETLWEPVTEDERTLFSSS